MSAIIDTLKDENGNTIYPQTKTNAVLDNNGNNVDELFDRITNYSTTEVAIGKWIDGSTIYRKTFTFTPDNNNSWHDIIDVTSLNINKIIDIGGSQYQYGRWFKLPVAEGTYYRNIAYNINSKNIQTINSGYEGDNMDGYITIEYTKNS